MTHLRKLQLSTGSCFTTMTQNERLNIRFIYSTILIWGSINLFLNLAGLIIKNWLSDDFEFRFDPYWHGKYIAYQTLTFSFVFISVYFISKQRKIATYSFVVIQLIAFHIIFFNNLVTYENVTRFTTSWPSFELTYLESNGQEIVDIISVYDPMTGTFDDGIFSPEKTFRFYLTWILLPLLYFLAICRLTEYFGKRIMLNIPT